MPSKSKCLVWFRTDLRLDDHLALSAAVKDFDQVIPVYIYSQEDEGNWPIGGASKWWLHHALESLDAELQTKGSFLVRRQGAVIETLREIIQSENVDGLYFNKRYEPHQVELETEIERRFHSELKLVRFMGNVLFEPNEIKTQQQKPYQVYTPYWKACVAAGPPPAPTATPKKIESPSEKPQSDRLESLNLLPEISWDKEFYDEWDPSLDGLRKLFKSFKSKVEDYKESRDIPSIDATSRMSPYLHFGQMSPRRLWHSIENGKVPKQAGKLHYMKEVVWREFAQYLLVHFPHLPDSPLRPEFKKFPWRKNAKDLKAWQKGQTGYPLVDAGMRQLWKTGWMHNRIRMVVASFLVKHLLIPWQDGAEWFWDCLVDADLGSNTLGWQWTGGCGPDAAPYFRIFNPITQGLKFDKDGDYIRRWVPELSKLSNSEIHSPWEMDASDLEKAGIVLGKDYPKPLVDHKEARERALSAYEDIKKSA